MSPHTSIPQPSAPIEWNKNLKAWTIWQYADVIEILKNPLFSATITAIEQSTDSIQKMGFDPTAYRSSFSQIIQKKSTWSKIQMTALAKEICGELQNQTRFDLQKHLTLPWCQRVAFRLTGIEAKEAEIDLLLQYASSVFMMTNEKKSPQAEKDILALSQYFLQLLHHRSQFPKEDLVSILAQNEQANSIFLSPIIQLFVGFTTSLPLLLGNVMLTLLTHPKHTQQFTAKPHYFVNELLRYAGPAQFVYRSVLSDIKIGEHCFKKGDRVALLLTYANKDAHIFQTPNELNFNSPPLAHLSLGKGAHACLGSPLIRDACAILPAMILTYLPHLKPEINGISWGGSKAIWGVKELRVSK